VDLVREARAGLVGAGSDRFLGAEPSTSEAGVAYVSEWLLEFSVLLAVFPFLGQALEQRYNIAVLSVSLTLAVLSFLGGLALAQKGRE
jgi:hypothetical protein